MPSNKWEEAVQSDIYLQRMVDDLKAAESKLREDIDYRGMSFSQSRLNDSQANVARLHELIRSYLTGNESTTTSKGEQPIRKEQTDE